MEYSFKSIFRLVDSAIVRAQVQKEFYGFGTFVATKIAEIQNKSDPGEWWWIATRDNPADLVTRPTSPNQIGPKSIWQQGPDFLRLPVEQWPISQTVPDQELSDRIGVHVMNIENQEEKVGIGEIVNVDKFNTFSKLLGVTGRFIQLKTD